MRPGSRCMLAMLFLTACGAFSDNATTGDRTPQSEQAPPDEVTKAEFGEVSTDDASRLERIIFQLRSDGPCLGIEELSPPFSDQAFAILRDTAKVAIWEYVPYYFGLAGGASDVEPLMRFVLTGVDASETAVQTRRSLDIVTGLQAGITGLGLLAARLEERAESAEADQAFGFLRDCMDPAYWNSTNVRWWQSSWDVTSSQAAQYAGACVSATYSGRKSRVITMLEERRAELRAAGRLGADLDEVFTTTLRRLARRPPGEFSRRVVQGKAHCPRQ